MLLADAAAESSSDGVLFGNALSALMKERPCCGRKEKNERKAKNSEKAPEKGNERPISPSNLALLARGFPAVGPCTDEEPRYPDPPAGTTTTKTLPHAERCEKGRKALNWLPERITESPPSSRSRRARTSKQDEKEEGRQV